MKARQKKGMGFAAIMLAGLFLFNPIAGFVDVLPDVFGYLLLWMGLGALSDLNECLQEARGRFRILFFIGIAQLYAMYYVYAVMPERASEMNRYEQPVMILLCSFLMLLAQWFLLIPALRDLFKGMDRLAEKYGSARLTRERRGKTAAERMISFSTFFVILHSVLSTLPELAILTSFEADVKNAHFPFDWYRFVNLFRIVAIFLALTVALIWLIRYLRYFVTAQRDREWVQGLRRTYENEILTQTEMLTVRKFRVSVLLCYIGILFSVSLRFDGMDALPSFVMALFFLLALQYLGALVPNSKQCRRWCLISGVASLLYFTANRLYLQSHLPEASLYHTDAYYFFFVTRLLGAVDAVVAMMLIYSMMRVLMDLVRTHTAVEYDGENSAELSARATQRLHSTFAKRNRVILILFGIAAVGNLLDVLLQLQLPWIWLISFVFAFAAIWNFYLFLHELFVQVQARYRTERTYKKP